MTHTIIIPHRNRNRHLAMCLRSLRRSAEQCGIGDYEVMVVDNGSTVRPKGDGPVRVIRSFAPMPIFNKPLLLNIGLLRATGDVVTVLDADAVVGPRFMEGVLPLEDSSITRVCYRVRYLPAAEVFLSLDGEPVLVPETIDKLFESYNDRGRAGDLFRKAWEAYRFPDRDRYEPSEQPWGNSQFSMRRRDLVGLRYDEQMAGKGMEDIDLNRQVYGRFRASFRGRIWTDGDHAMFHLTHPKSPDFDTESIKAANHARYDARWPRPCEKERHDAD